MNDQRLVEAVESFMNWTCPVLMPEALKFRICRWIRDRKSLIAEFKDLPVDSGAINGAMVETISCQRLLQHPDHYNETIASAHLERDAPQRGGP